MDENDGVSVGDSCRPKTLSDNYEIVRIGTKALTPR
jgi:hypothetical protein